MRVVLDTNILISALVFGGKPRIILELILFRKKLIGVTSHKLVNELLSVLKFKFKYLQRELDKIQKIIKENFIIVDPKIIPEIIKEDAFDNQVLAVTDEINIDFIISGDYHLLKIKSYKNIPIIKPNIFLKLYFDNK